MLGLTLIERAVTPSDDGAAVEQDCAQDLDLAGGRANAMDFAAPNGRAVWSLQVPGAPSGGGTPDLIGSTAHPS